MLKRSDTFLPVTIAAGLPTEVSTSWNGDFRVKQAGELYLNPFHEGHRFFRITKLDVLDGPVQTLTYVSILNDRSGLLSSRVHHDLPEHLALLQIFVRRADLTQRKRPVQHRF